MDALLPFAPAPSALAPDPNAARWAEIIARRPSGSFVYGVTSTGIFCRSDCPARRPRRENVRFFDTVAEAEAAGFRPCRRCRPQAPVGDALVEDACRRLSRTDPVPLPELIASLDIGRRQFFARFKAATGITPGAFLRQVRAERARQTLAEGGTVTQAIHAAGFAAPSRFYETWARDTSVPPAKLRRGGAGLAIVYGFAASSLGEVLAAATERGLCAILLGTDRAALATDLRARFPNAELRPADPGFAETLATVVAQIEAPGRPCPLPLDIQGTLFQRKVWAALREIPPGETLSYARLAAACGLPRATRAVATACAANPLAVVVPCHRIIRGDGGLGGYRWGLARKETLLRRESS